MQILAIINGDYGKRHVDNIISYAPNHWEITVWSAPTSYPLVIDYPEDYLPANFMPANLILSFSEHKAIAELLPDIAEMSSASAVIAAIDNESWLPRGLARQLRQWLKEINVECVTPKPLCSLTEEEYMMTRSKSIKYSSPFIKEFAKYFGMPKIKIKLNSANELIIGTEVVRDAVCGNARYIAHNLIGTSIDQVTEKTGLLHHHYPCLASMGKDLDYNYDTLMHVSGNFIKDNVSKQIKSYLQNQYITPNNNIKTD